MSPEDRSEPQVAAVSEDGVVHYHFPVEIEVRAAGEPVDAEALVERALWRLAEGLSA